MNKGLLYGIGGIVVAGIGFGIYKFINKKSEEPVEEVVKENASETITEEKDEDDFLERMMAEEKEAEEATKNWTEREAACKREMDEKASIKDQNMFTDNVSESKEFKALNKIREASGKASFSAFLQRFPFVSFISTTSLNSLNIFIFSFLFKL